jgi:hypothetical protein
MAHREDFTAKVRTVGLGSTFVASAVIGLTLVADTRLSGAVGSGTRPGRILLLAVAGILCVANLALVVPIERRRGGTDQNSGLHQARRIHVFGDVSTGSAND